MKWNELSDFTYDELSNFTWGEMRLTAEELLEKCREDNRMLPISAVEKLQEICEELPPEVPKPSTLKTIKDIAVFVNTIYQLGRNLAGTVPVIQKILDVIASLF